MASIWVAESYPAQKNALIFLGLEKKKLILPHHHAPKISNQESTANLKHIWAQKSAERPFCGSETSGHPTPARSLTPSPEGDESDPEEEEEDLDLLIHFDLVKINLAYEEENPDYIEEDEDEELLERMSNWSSKVLFAQHHLEIY